ESCRRSAVLNMPGLNMPGFNMLGFNMYRFADRRTISCILLLPCVFVSVFAAAQNGGPRGNGEELKGKLQLTRNGRYVRDASKVVVWLTPLGTTPAPAPPQQTRPIPQMAQKNKSF